MARDCVEQTTKKYTNRKSPPYPANVCPVGDKKKGNDGKMYVVSEPNKNGVSRWVLEKTCLLYTSPSPRDQRGSRMPSSA